MNAFEVIDKAIDVAAHDYPDQLRFLRYRIAQRLFSGDLSSSWNFEALAPPLEISDENSVMEFDQDRHNAPNPKDEAMKTHQINVEDGGKRPRLIIRIKTKRSEEQDQETKSKKPVKRVSRKACKGKDAAKSGKKIKRRDETKVLCGGDGQQFVTRHDTSIRKITKIRFVHGFN